MSGIVGHYDVRRDLAAAFLRSDLPGSLLVHGPAGVGRQTLGLWLARLLLCQAPSAEGPCEECRSCRLALELQHPDLHWFFPLPRPKGVSGPDRLADALEESRAEALAERRGSPARRPEDGPVGLYVAQVRTIRRLAASRPAMGRRQAFVIGDAELLVPQEASQEAANALLKVLEEPSSVTTFILTAADPDTLLPTIRSRCLPVRLRPLPEETVIEFLNAHADVDGDRIRLAASLARGSIGRALAFLPDEDGEPGAGERARIEAGRILDAVAGGSPGDGYALALGQAPVGARGAFADVLDHLGTWLRDLAAVAAGAEQDIINVDSITRLRKLAGDVRAASVPEAIGLVDQARADGRTNVNPQLTLAWLGARLRETLAA